MSDTSTPEASTAPTGEPSADAGKATPTTEPAGNSGQETSVSDAVQESKTESGTGQSKPAGKPSKIDLYKSEEFRRHQAAQDRQIAEERRRAQELQNQLAAMQRAKRDAELASMNDYEREKALRADAEAAAAEAFARLQVYEQRAARDSDIRELHNKTGAPIDLLEKAETYEEAQNMALDYVVKQADASVKERVKAALEADNVNRPDTGGGKTKATPTPREEAFANARTATDYVKALLTDLQ